MIKVTVTIPTAFNVLNLIINPFIIGIKGMDSGANPALKGLFFAFF